MKNWSRFSFTFPPQVRITNKPTFLYGSCGCFFLLCQCWRCWRLSSFACSWHRYISRFEKIYLTLLNLNHSLICACLNWRGLVHGMFNPVAPRQANVNDNKGSYLLFAFLCWLLKFNTNCWWIQCSTKKLNLKKISKIFFAQKLNIGKFVTVNVACSENSHSNNEVNLKVACRTKIVSTCGESIGPQLKGFYPLYKMWPVRTKLFAAPVMKVGCKDGVGPG